MSISLPHDYAIFIATEDFDFVDYIRTAPGEVAFSFHNHLGFPLPVAVFTKSGGFLLICVFIDYPGDPEALYILLSEGIQIVSGLEIVISCSVLLPFQNDLKLDFD